MVKRRYKRQIAAFVTNFPESPCTFNASDNCGNYLNEIARHSNELKNAKAMVRENKYFYNGHITLSMLQNGGMLVGHTKLFSPNAYAAVALGHITLSQFSLLNLLPVPSVDPKALLNAGYITRLGHVHVFTGLGLLASISGHIVPSQLQPFGLYPFPDGAMTLNGLREGNYATKDCLPTALGLAALHTRYLSMNHFASAGCPADDYSHVTIRQLFAAKYIYGRYRIVTSVGLTALAMGIISRDIYQKLGVFPFGDNGLQNHADEEGDREGERDQSQERERERDQGQDQDQGQGQEREREPGQELEREREPGQELERERELGQELEREREPGQELEREREQGQEREREREQGQEREREREQGQEREREREQGQERERELEQGQEREREREQGQEREREREQGQEREREREQGQEREREREREQGQEREREREPGQERERERERDPKITIVRELVAVGYFRAYTHFITAIGFYAVTHNYINKEYLSGLNLWPCSGELSMTAFLSSGYITYSGHLTSLGYALLHAQYFSIEWLAKLGIFVHDEFYLYHHALGYSGYLKSAYHAIHISMHVTVHHKNPARQVGVFQSN
jgi:hypothetical protein